MKTSITIKQNLKSGLVILIMGLFSACGGAAGSGDGEERGATAQSEIGGVITELDLDGSRAVAHFNEVDATENYTIALFSYDFEEASTYGFEMGASLSGQALTRAQNQNDVSEDIHETLRALEEGFENEETMSTQAHTRSVSRESEVGDEENFKVLSSISGSSTVTVTATLRYVTNNFYVYVDNRNAASLSDDEIEQIYGRFDDHVADERNLFGEESDVNNDGHFVILLTQAVNELGYSGGGMLTGYFYAADLYSHSVNPASNEMEIVYSMVPDPSGSFGVRITTSFAKANLLGSVAPHEFQHMINYNQHVLEHSGASERSYLNEGLSHLAEDIYSMDSDHFMAETGIENPSRVAQYLDATDSTCFTCGSSLVQRGGSYLFIRYLYEQAELGNLSGAQNGAELIGSLLATNKVGMSNIVDAALGSSDTSLFKDLMGNFSLALLLSDTGASPDNRFQFLGLNLRSAQNDNRGTRLDGPLATQSDSISSTLASSGISYMVVSGQSIINADSTLSITVDSAMNGGGYVIHNTLDF
ncbi:hypothetical protein K1X76_02405 [bacterium]|nr:hypothetical protein [bacterium]